MNWTQAPSINEPVKPENLLKDAGLPEILPEDDDLRTDVRRAQMRRYLAFGMWYVDLHVDFGMLICAQVGLERFHQTDTQHPLT